MSYFGGILDEFHEEWYAKHLLAMGEPPLDPVPDAARYRFLWLRTYNPAIAVRVEARAGGAALYATEMTGMSGFETGAVARSTRIDVTAEQ